MTVRPARSAVPVEQTWNLEGLYPTPEDWEADLAAVDASLPDLSRYAGRLGDGPQELLACLRTRDRIEKHAYRVYWYAHNRLSEDQADPARQSFQARGTAMYARVASALSFIRPELLALPDGTVESYLGSEPELGIYRLQLTDILAEKKHMLGTEAESVLAQMSELMGAPYDIWNSTTNADIKFDPVTDEEGNQVPMSLSAMMRLLQSHDRSVRAAAYESARKGFADHKRTIAAAFAAAQKRDATVARLRRYSSSLAAELEPEYLPEALFHNLLKVAEEGTEHFRRYMSFRRRELGLDTLMPWDLQAPLDLDLKADISYEDAFALIKEALAPLGSGYRTILERAHGERWVDWADNAGKRFGAYSAPIYDYNPVICMTWQGKVADAFTLAHELGHSAHAVFARKQPFPYYHSGLFLAEMASTANELLLARHMLKTTTDRALRRYVLTRALSAFTSNFFGGSLSAAFQLHVHEAVEKGQALTYESITEAFTAILKRWYGDTVEVTPEGMGHTWMRAPHNFRGFYSYQYATGISAAAAFVDAILSEGEPAVKRFLGFLNAGSSAHAIDILKEAGVDMTTPEPIEKAVALFADLVDELERT